MIKTSYAICTSLLEQSEDDQRVSGIIHHLFPFSLNFTVYKHGITKSGVRYVFLSNPYQITNPYRTSYKPNDDLHLETQQPKNNFSGPQSPQTNLPMQGLRGVHFDSGTVAQLTFEKRDSIQKER
jgi:hypothetical protein